MHQQQIYNDAGGKNMLPDFIFVDCYRTFILCVLSMGIAFRVRNESNKKKLIAFVGYEIIVFLFFSWILIVVAGFTMFSYEAIIEFIIWDGKWILYFTISMLSQLMVYHLLWKKNIALKAVSLAFNAIIIIAPLYIFNFETGFY